MLNYTILSPTGDTMIMFPLSMDNNPKNHDENNDFASATAIAAINPILNLEKDGYNAASSYSMGFNFIGSGDLYYSTWNAAGFNMPSDVNKNVFKKSEFLIEFYDTNQESNNLQFSTTLSIYPNKNGKGADSTGSGTAITVSTKFTVSSIANELYLLYYYRDFDSIPNVKSETGGRRYVSLFMKVMFLNAKTGNVHYFFESPNFLPLTSATFIPSVYYNEIRFYEDLTYAFYRNGVQISTLNFNEIYVRP